MPDQTEALLRGSLLLAKVRALRGDAHTLMEEAQWVLMHSPRPADGRKLEREYQHRWYLEQLDAILKAVEADQLDQLEPREGE